MEDRLTYTASVLYIPAMLSVQVRMCVWTVTLYQLGKQVTASVFECCGVWKLSDEGKLF